MRNKRYLKPRPLGRFAAKCLLLVLMLLPQMAWADYYYKKADGTIVSTNDAIVLSDNAATLSDNIYVVSGNVTISGRCNVTTDVTLVLLDGATLTAEGGIGMSSNCSITITVGNTTNEIAGTGTLKATGTDCNPGIGNNYGGDGGGTVNIVDGNIEATGGSAAAGIGSGKAMSGGIVNIYGGTIEAIGTGAAGIGSGTDGTGDVLSISGYAEVFIRGTEWSMALNCSSATATAPAGYVVYVEEIDGTPIASASSTFDLIDIGLGTEHHDAHIFMGTAYTVTYDANGGSGSMDSKSLGIGESFTISENKFTYDNRSFTEWNTQADGTGRSYKPGDEVGFGRNTTLYAQWGSLVYYLTVSGDIATADEYRTVTESTDAPSDGIWVVNGTTTLNSVFYVDYNEVTLILLDGAKLIAPEGINLNSTGKLTITAGNMTDAIACTGALIAQSDIDYQSGIGCDQGEVNIIAGNITASGGESAAGIGGGLGGEGATVTIYGGNVTATGGADAAGIGGGAGGAGGDVSILDGTVKATGGENASAIGGGSGGSGGTLTISGTADVTVKSTTDGVYALNCETATATPSNGYSVYVQGKDKNNFTGTPSTSVVDLNKLGLGSSAQYAHIFFADASVDVTIGSTKYATLYYSDRNLVVPADKGVKAYIVTAAEAGTDAEGKATLTRLESNIIPAGTAVVLKADAAGTYTFSATQEACTDEVSGNLLRGKDEAALTTADDGDAADYKFYKLSRNSTRKKVGFYYDVDNGGAFIIPAHKAYLVLPRTQSANIAAYLFDLDDTVTAVNNAADSSEADTEIYDLSGRRCGTDVSRLPAGIYVRNGKKIIIK